MGASALATPLHPAVSAVYTVVWLILLFLTWIVAWILQSLVMICPFWSVVERQDICGHIFRYCNFLTVDLLNPFWTVKVLRPLPDVREKRDKFICCMNHLSNADPWVCIRAILPNDCKWICKGSLMKLPFGGWALENAGDLAVHFTNEKGGWGTAPGSVSTMMSVARHLLHRKKPIAVFPEGVRNKNPDGPLNEFKLGFFTLAVAEGAKVVPIAMSGSERCWPKGDWKWNRAHVYLSCGDPISSEGLSAEQLRDKTVAAIEALRATHPDIIERHGKKKK